MSDRSDMSATTPTADSTEPALRARADPSDSRTGLTGEHSRLWAWVSAALDAMRREMREDVGKVSETLHDVSTRLALLEGGEEERARWRDNIDSKLDAIVSRLPAQEQRGWLGFVSSPWAIALAALAVMSGVLFGPAFISDRIDHIRGADLQVERGRG